MTTFLRFLWVQLSYHIYKMQYCSWSPGPLALKVPHPRILLCLLSLRCRGRDIDYQVWLGAPQSGVLCILTSYRFLWWSPSGAKRKFTDERWEWHLPVGARIRVWGAVRNHCFRKVMGWGSPLGSQDLISHSYVAKFTGLNMKYIVLSGP